MLQGRRVHDPRQNNIGALLRQTVDFGPDLRKKQLRGRGAMLSDIESTRFCLKPAYRHWCRAHGDSQLDPKVCRMAAAWEGGRGPSVYLGGQRGEHTQELQVCKQGLYTIWGYLDPPGNAKQFCYSFSGTPQVQAAN